MGQAKLPFVGMSGLRRVTVGHPDLGLGVAEEIIEHRSAAAVSDQMVDGGRRQQHPLPPVLALDPSRGLVRADHGAGANFRRDRRRAGAQRGLRAGDQVGDRPFADADREHLVEQLRQPLEPDRLGDVQMDDQRRQIGAERRARRHAGRRRGAEPAPAMRAGAAMPVNAGDDRTNRRQLNMIVGVKRRLIGRAQLMRAMRAALGEAVDNLVRIVRQCPKNAGPALALLRRAPFGTVWLAPLRGRHRGVVWGLGRLPELGFQFSDAPRQFHDLRRLRPHQRDQLVPGEFREVILIHPQVESREYTLVNQNLHAYRLRPTICAPVRTAPSLTPRKGVSSYVFLPVP
jgi:hypothetical protein